MKINSNIDIPDMQVNENKPGAQLVNYGWLKEKGNVRREKEMILTGIL